jgi:hypothetical protein
MRHSVRRLYERLKAAGFDVWFDRVSMPSRELTFSKEIEDAIWAALYSPAFSRAEPRGILCWRPRKLSGRGFETASARTAIIGTKSCRLQTENC